MHERSRAWRLPGWLLIAILGLLIASPVSSQLGNRMEIMFDDGMSGSAPLDAWDAVDEAIDLTGLWGSIDTENDIDPVWIIRPEDGTVYLVWAEWNGLFYEIVYSQRPPSGNWTGVLKVETTPSSTYDNVTPSIVTDLQGRLHVTWVREAQGGSVIMHSLRVGGPWTMALVISGAEPAHSPSVYLMDGVVRVDYFTATMRVTVEIVIYESAGGSDEVDPGTGVEVESNEVANEILPQ